MVWMVLRWSTSQITNVCLVTRPTSKMVSISGHNENYIKVCYFALMLSSSNSKLYSACRHSYKWANIVR